MKSTREKHHLRGARERLRKGIVASDEIKKSLENTIQVTEQLPGSKPR
jgi:hypothetical protein